MSVPEWDDMVSKKDTAAVFKALKSKRDNKVSPVPAPSADDIWIHRCVGKILYKSEDRAEMETRRPFRYR